MTRLVTSRGPVELRELNGLAELQAAEDIQQKVWGAGVHPKEMLIPVQHEGGLLAGAFTGSGEMVSLVFSFPTADPHVTHSQLLATLHEWRGLGIGTQLKWFQRQWCLARGITHVRWTVDPLRAANAEINIRHLGGTTATYFPDYYGMMGGIDAGAPSDRFLIDWDLNSERVTTRVLGVPEDRGFSEECIANFTVDGRPKLASPTPFGHRVIIRIPENYISLSKEEPGLALTWRMQVRQLCQAYFSAGYVLIDFTRVNGPAYLLEKDWMRK